MNARKLSLTTFAVLCALTGLLGFGSTSVSAFLKHEYISQITGTPEGSFSNACGVTLDPASQDLYVTDYGHEAFDIFDPSGVSAYTYKSHTGLGYGFQGQVVCDMAVSDVTGDVYVSHTSVVDVFGPSGVYLKTIDGSSTPNGSFTNERGNLHVAVDNGPLSPSYGDVYIAAPSFGVVDKFNSANEYKSQLSGLPAPEPLAVDSEGDVYVGDIPENTSYATGKNEIREFNSSGTEIGQFAQGSPSHVAVDSAKNVYVASDSPNSGAVVDEYSSSGTFEGRTSGAPSLTTSHPTGVVVNSAGYLYVAESTTVDIFGPGVLVPDVGVEAPNLTGTTATLRGTVNPDGTQVKSCVFEYGPTIAYGQVASCEPTPTTGNSPVVVSANLSGLQSGTEYHYRLVAANASGNNASEDKPFFILGPHIRGEFVSDVGLHRATANAQINAEGLPTTYVIEYGLSKAYGSVTPRVSVGAGSGLVGVSAILETVLEGILQPETTYHFRVTATNKDATALGPDVTFSTLSSFTGLPDGRGYELVSPAANANGDVYIPGIGQIGNRPANLSGVTEEETPQPMQASADGNAVKYYADPLTRDGNGRMGLGAGNAYVATRDPSGGWSRVDLETPGFDEAPFQALFSNELSNSGTSAVSAGSHSLSENGEGLFDSVDGRLVTVSVLPDGTIVSKAVFGTIAQIPGFSPGEYDHVVSADGSRIFWTDVEKGLNEDRIFVRENGDRTIPVSAGGATYWTASLNGRYVFYTEGEVLWRFDVENEEREALAGKGAGVLGVIGVNETGEEGAYTYFVANGVLAPDAPVGNCQGTASGATEACNLYMQHAGITTYIATLPASDNLIAGFEGYGYIGFLTSGDQHVGDWVSALGERTSQVAPDGHSVVFMSRASLTRYNSNGTLEVYVYDADTGRVLCASCQPSGVSPSGVSSFGGAALPWSGLSPGAKFQHRWISEDGSRVFFDSLEALVGSDTNGVQDVYEWEREGSGSCQVKSPARQDGGCVYLLSGGINSDESYFLDASANGNDVFIISRAELVPQDQGETYEVYDDRVGAVQSPTEPACTGTGCQGLPAGPPLFATPSSVTFNGVGNFSSSPPVVVTKVRSRAVKCSKGKRLSHGRCVKVKARKNASKYGRKRGAK